MQDKKDMEGRFQQLQDQCANEIQHNWLPAAKPPDPGNFPGPHEDRLATTATDKDAIDRAKQASILEYHKRNQERGRRDLIDIVREQRPGKDSPLVDWEAWLTTELEKERRARNADDRDKRDERDEDRQEKRSKGAIQKDTDRYNDKQQKELEDRGWERRREQKKQDDQGE